MLIRFEFGGRRFEVLSGERLHLLVDGDLQADVEVVTPGPQIKPETNSKSLDEAIARAENDLQRCLECGSAKKKWIRAQENTISVFKFARDYKPGDYAAPRIPGIEG